MRGSRRFLALALVMALVIALLSPAAIASKQEHRAPHGFGSKAYSYIEKLTTTVATDGATVSVKRTAGTESEVQAAAKVEGWLEHAGYQTTLQPFTYVRRGVTYTSQNVVGYLPAHKRVKKGETRQLVIMGAHYDASNAGAGADDNASGVGVITEVAHRIAESEDRDFDLAVVAFGAEEVGLKGSAFYLSQLAQADKDRTSVMINFDSLIVGDKLYIHGGANGKTWARDEMLKIIKKHRLPIETQPGLNAEYPAGLTPDGFSDYTAFNQAGIPVVAFESTNWEIGDLDGYEQTVDNGSFWHTDRDFLTTIEATYPGRPMIRLKAYTTLTYEFLKHLSDHHH